jgi:hypothetical protein
MSDQPMGDAVYQPDNEEQADAAALDLEDALDERDYDDILDEGYSPPEKPLGATRFGVTEAEQRDGETLDQRLAEEEPDVGAQEWGTGDLQDGDGEPIDSEVGAARSGRLVAPDEGAHGDDETDLIASDIGIDGGAASAEEAAMHLVPDEDLDY